jgi:hypothetical protein
MPHTMRDRTRLVRAAATRLGDKRPFTSAGQAQCVACDAALPEICSTYPECDACFQEHAAEADAFLQTQSKKQKE